MGLQVNPYLVWQLVPGIVTLAIGLYVLTRYRGRRESGVFFVMMVGGALWAFADAIRLLSPNLEWQRMWINVVYIGVMIVPTSWFMLSTKLAGLKRGLATNLSNWAWLVPAGMYLAVLSNNRHNLFFTSSVMVDTGVFSVVENQYGPLFFAHTAYSYVALVAGVVIIGIEISRNFRRYGVQAYGLIAGVLAPLLGNVYYLFGSVPAGFPDLTPIFFTVTGVAFGWAIFGSRILEVVPHAHGSIVETLTTGVIVLGPDMRILDANQSAREILESARTESGDADPDRIDGGSAVDEAIVSAAGSLQSEGGAVQAVVPATGRTYSITVDPISVDVGKSTGWLVQLTDVSERTRTELDLIETRETLEAVLDTLQDSYFEADVNGVLTYANRALLETLNYSRRDEVIGRHFRKFVDARSARDMYERFSQLFSTGQPVPRFAYFFRRNGGEVREAEASISPIIRNGAVVGSRGTLRDISERVKAERKTAEQTDLLNSVMQQSPIAMAICDLDRKITRVNPAFEGLFGYPKHEALGAELDALLSVPELAREMEELTTRSLEGFVSAASRRRRADGSLVDVEIFAAPLSVGGSRVGFLAFYIDVSERTRAQSELARTQSTVSSILNSLEDPYFEADSAGVITFANRSYWQQLGYDSDKDVLGRSFRHFTDRQTVREVLRRFSVLYRTGEPAEPFDYQCKRKDGSTFVAEIVVSPVLDGEQVVGTRGIIRDASVRIKAEEVLRQAKEAAEFRAGELATINRVASKVSRSLDLNEILDSVCRELTTIFEIRNAGVGLLTPDRRSLEIVAFHSVDPNEESALGMVLPFRGNESSEEVINQQKTVVVQDAQTDPRMTPLAELSRIRGTKSIMIVPIMTRGEAIGTIGMPARDPEHEFTDAEVELAETIGSQLAAAIDNAKLHGQTERALNVAERDLEIGRQIQADFFPETLPRITGWEIAAHFHAARQVAGDFYDVFKFRDSELTAFVVADVCDKGVGAALFMVLFRSLLRAFSERPVDTGGVHAQLHSMVLSTNNFIAEYHGRSNMFATMFIGILDPGNGILHFVNAGHEPPVMLDVDGKVKRRLMPTGPAVGLFPDMEYAVEEIRFVEGDCLVGFTDGATDAMNGRGDQFSEDRLLKTIGFPWSSPFSLLFELNGELRRHIGSRDQFDDITLVALRRQSSASPGPHAICRSATMDVVGDLREFVESAARYENLNPDGVLAFKLSADEVCTNIVEHGFAGREPGLISLFFTTEGTRARLVIQDDGEPFAPEDAAVPDLEADWQVRQIGGLGIHFVRELMDDVWYGRSDQGANELILEKELE